MPTAVKKKILNDPVYGFVAIPNAFLFQLVEHPYFQRLRRINQLGLTNLVYNGANHSRFQHAIGATHLMEQAIDVLRSKGNEITEEEANGVMAAILLHDIGHGPYSHTLENTIISGVSHETISLLFMHELNEQFNNQLEIAIQIFTNKYPKKFLHQLVSSQLDMDRLDYLKRDTFFSGVSEGVIGSSRIIKMLNVHNDELVIEEKGIYSIEKFIVARRIMYWQVYMHKTVLVAEFLLMKILERAKELVLQGEQLFATPALGYFLNARWTAKNFTNSNEALEHFAQLDDFDILTSIKVWQKHTDKVLSLLCSRLLNRELFKVEIQNEPFDLAAIELKKKRCKERHHLTDNEVSYFVFSGVVENNAYNPKNEKINIQYKDGRVLDITEAADLLNISALSKTVQKHYLIYPKEFFKL